MILSQGRIQIKDKTVDSITFKIEDLSKPEDLLKEQPYEEVIAKFSSKIEAYSEVDVPIVSNGFHSFIYGMYQAYAEHRPFVLSPDMIWLLICQGFSKHVNFGKGTENEVFPHLNTKEVLIIANDNINLGDKDSPWAESTKQFTEAISNKIGEELVNVLRADFSTTGINERVASEITIMDAMKPYFEYILMICICGIPEITIEGSTGDWEKIQSKLSKLRKYNLNWWGDRLDPIINEFIEATKGIINKAFWINMFKVHEFDEYGAPETIDGWITKFYPYDRKGNLTNFEEMKMLTVKSICEELPKELVCVDFICRLTDGQGNTIKDFPMEYWAGFVGLRQDKENFSLRPEIGWFVSHKNNSISNESKHKGESDSRVYYNLTSFPEEILKTKEWSELILNFKDEVVLPLSILKISMDMLELNGKISGKDKVLLQLLKKKFHVKVNGKFI